MAKPNEEQAESTDFIDDMNVGGARGSGDSKFDTFTKGHKTMSLILSRLEKSPKHSKIKGVAIREIFESRKGGKVMVDKILTGLALTQLGVSKQEVLAIVNSKTYAKDE